MVDIFTVQIKQVLLVSNVLECMQGDTPAWWERICATHLALMMKSTEIIMIVVNVCKHRVILQS